ncbi:MAG: glycoside hydrolase family 5 protein [Oscillospiraceae bacterium]|nr:glycoside hydrolase family 5 protein [Oscillospiraceae bacterium]
MRKSSLLKIVSVLALSAAVLTTAASISASAAGKFETASDAVDNIKIGWNLGNTLDSHGDWIGLYTEGKTSDYETAWGNPVTTKKLITAVKNAGFNAVRVPVTWAEHIDDSGNIDKKWLDRVQEVVDYVISQDLYCVLDVHHDAGPDGWLKASESSYKSDSKKFAGLWKNIAVRFRDYDEKLIFEGWNEVLDSRNSWNDARQSDAYEAANKYNQLFVDTVRKTGGNNGSRNLMVQVYGGSVTEKALAGFVLPKDTVKDHLIIQIHYYDPQGFTFSDATWTAMTDKWGTDAEKSYMDKQLERLGKFAQSQGVPLVVGEFGADFKNNNSSRKLYAEHFVNGAAKYGIKCFWWDTGNMALFDREKCEVAHPEIVNVLTE